MAHLTSKDMGLRIDSSTGVLQDISGSVNNQSFRAAQTILDDTGIGDTGHTNLSGLAQAARIPLNGMVDSTVEAIFGPLIGGTSITKTVEYQISSSRYYNGEFWVENWEKSGRVDDLQVFSCELVSEDVGSINRTSVALS